MEPRVAVTIVVTLAILAGAVWAIIAGGSRATEPSHASGPSPTPSYATLSVTEPPEPEVVVFVSGAVTAPGLVVLPAQARVADALEAAGGAAPEAASDALNLARHVTDGEHIHVLTHDEWEQHAAAATGGGADAAGPLAATRDGGLINVNSATVEELQGLPGVGPAIAARISDERDTGGPFASVDDLQRVAGIGPATVEKLRAHATV